MLGRLIHRDQHLWRPRPFMDPNVAWRAALPEVYAWLMGLSYEAIDGLDRHLSIPATAPPRLRRLAEELEAVTRPLRAPLARIELRPDRRLLWKVPGRKWSQIEALASVAGEVLQRVGRRSPEPVRIVDWCAGKGHLGRLIAHSHPATRVTHLERQLSLCETGARLAERAGRADTSVFVPVDVLTQPDKASAVLGPQTVAVGLHACGALSTRLVAAAVEREVPAVIVSTCCYHKLAADQDVYLPYSGPGRQLGLELDRGALRLPTADEVNAGAARRRRRRRELAWRQGFQLLVAEATGDERYHPLGALPRRHLGKGFEHFCRHVAAALSLQLPARWSPEKAEAAGWERSRAARALALLRGLYRRPLETWLICDRAVGLLERGYRATVGVFCEPGITPRNLALVACRSD